ncbi:Fur-regulated basic protein FbpA [Bacillus sp. Marseille-P3661]|uniref:Fur-regulated basic protein FbpA n=1 Tax=Bacillus sp. Marseille-P3661 TaxID=1936234 RepID=UPI000C866EEA|nr:Fur-regulated basic protein FbpA [Bacillus sp. Marseille-P3661]
MPLLRYIVEQQKNKLIKELIRKGIYKKNDLYLYQLTLTELEEIYKLRVQNHTNDRQQL